MTKANTSLENQIFTELETIANNSKSRKLSSSEFEKFVKFVPTNVRSNVLVILNEYGLITRTSKCDSIFLQHIKRDIDENLLSSLLEKGSYTIKIDKQEWLDKIVVDPQNNESSRLYVESDVKNEKDLYEFYHVTINNGNEYARRETLRMKNLMKEANLEK